jgi:hypothetical protein
MKGSNGKMSKKNNRRKGGGGRVVGLTPGNQLFPPRFTGKMVYVQAYTISIVAGAVTTQTFRANSVYDPDYGGVGTTVAGYAQPAALYGRYRVPKFTADIEFLNTSAQPVYVYAVGTTENTIGTSFSVLTAQRNVWTKAIASKDGAAMVKHKVSFPIHRIYGVPKSQVMLEDDFAGLTGANPNNQVFFHCGVYNPTASTAAVILRVRFTYHTIWSLPVDLPY